MQRIYLKKLAGLVPSYLSCLVLFLPLSVSAANLPDIIAQAVKTYPAVIQAQIDADTAVAQTKQANLLYMPTFGVQARQNVQNTTTNNVLVGKWNLYAGGSTEERVREARYNEQYKSHLVDETGESLAREIANIYMTGLSAKLQLEAQKRNFERHQAIIDKMRIIVSYDPGRQSDLTQATSRQSQVRTQMVRLQTEVLKAENQLQKYLDSTQTIEWVLPQHLIGDADYATHPSLMAAYANELKSDSSAKVTMKSRRPQLDLQMTGGANRQAYLAVNWQFFDPATSAGQAEVDNAAKKARVRTEEIRRNIDEQVRTAMVDVKQTEEQIRATESQITAQKQVIEAFELQFSIARRTILDVLNAYSELSTIEVSKAIAEINRQQALINLRYASGKLVDWAVNQ